MGLPKFLLGVVVGIAGTYFAKRWLPSCSITSEHALKIVKQEIKKQGPIDGSWVHMKPEILVRNNISYKVFTGGISRTIDNNPEQLEFIVNAENGTILDITHLNK